MLKNGEVGLIINTPPAPSRARTKSDPHHRLYQRVPVMTTLAAAQATLRALRSLKTKPSASNPSRNIITGNLLVARTTRCPGSRSEQEVTDNFRSNSI